MKITSPLCLALVALLPFSASAQLQQACILLSDGNVETSQGGAIQTADGGFAIAGTRVNGVQEDVTLAKLDANGGLEWFKVISTTGGDWGESVLQTSDGGFAIGGYTDTPDGRAFLLLKLGASGAFEWAKTYAQPGFSLYIENDGFIQTSDGGFAFCGSRFSNDGCCLLRTNAVGDPLWSKVLETYLINGRDIAETPDGDLVMVAGAAVGFPNGLVARMEGLTGVEIWKNSYSIATNDLIYPYSVTIGLNNSIVLCGSQVPNSGAGAGNGGVDMVAMSLASDGTPQWVTMLGSADNEHGSAIATTPDGDYILAGDSWTGGGATLDGYAARLNDVGQLQWAKRLPFPGTSSQILHASIAADGDYLFSGYRGGALGDPFWKMDPAGITCPYCGSNAYGAALSSTVNVLPPGAGSIVDNWAVANTATYTVTDITATVNNDVCGTTVIEDPTAQAVVSIAPNPFSTSTTITVPQEWVGSARLVLHDMLGREVRSSRITSSVVRVDRDDLKAGPYSYRVVGVHGALASGVLLVE